ncbi:MAG TPA: PGF-pre-PGF domain-containing protein, partial [Archaeoglobus profundus]|nr:PGF-pre-PGF domain-containing protein [Archaeoglobus profundus]
NKTVEGTITFNVSKDWLNKHGIDKNQIVLMKYVDGKWIELKTRVVGEDKQYVYYEAETPSFSYYAIAAKEVTPTITPTVTPTESKQQTPTPEMTPTPTPEKTETPTPEQTPPKETPGFEIVIGLIGVIVSLMLRRKS